MEMRTDEIIVRTQKEWDDIPQNFRGYVTIQGNKYIDDPIVISNEKGVAINVRKDGLVEVRGGVQIYGYENAEIRAFENSRIIVGDKAVVYAYNRARVKAYSSCRIILNDKAYAEATDNCEVRAKGNSFVKASDFASVEAHDHAIVKALGYSKVWAHDRAYVKGRDYAKITAYGSSVVDAVSYNIITAFDYSNIRAKGGCSALISAYNRAKVEAHDYCRVFANGDSCVEADGHVFVRTRDAASAKVTGYVSVKAEGRSNITAYGNTSIVAYDESSIKAEGPVQIIVGYKFVKLDVDDKVSVVLAYDTPEEYCNFYGVKVRDGKAILYKAVDSSYRSFYDPNFKYTIGAEITEVCDESRDVVCSTGLHVSPLEWALEFGNSGKKIDFKILECSVPLSKIIVPKGTDGKVRTSQLVVLREVPREEWGIFGKVIENDNLSNVMEYGRQESGMMGS